MGSLLFRQPVGNNNFQKIDSYRVVKLVKKHSFGGAFCIMLPIYRFDFRCCIIVSFFYSNLDILYVYRKIYIKGGNMNKFKVTGLSFMFIGLIATLISGCAVVPRVAPVAPPVAPPTQTITVNTKTAEEYFQIGTTFFGQGNLSQAISNLTKAIEIDPKLAKAYNNRGFVYATQGNFPQAVADFTNVIGITPQDADAYYNRGYVYSKQSNFNQAISDFSKAIEIDPKLAKAYYGRGRNYYNIKEYDKAWADVHKTEGLGTAVSPEFITELKKVSGRDK
ncbi:MAG: hypothetical protein ACD_77C00360G0001 [uncultured bacterium]|nr:MAG: hypothetical protein ACD_77C00360G0001 [uncultured bacterium]